MPEEIKEKTEEMRMEHVKDRDLDNDGVPDIWYDPKAKGLAFKDTKVKEIYEKYISYGSDGKRPILSVGAILVDVVKQLEKGNELLEKLLSK